MSDLNEDMMISVDFELLREKLGYKVYKPRVGIVGRALIKAANESITELSQKVRKQLNEFFKRERRLKNNRVNFQV